MALSAPPPPRSVSDSVALSSIFYRRRESSVKRSRARIGEIAGSTAADCAAICCCFPCGIVSLVVLALVKLPAGLCRRAYVRRRRRRIAMRMKTVAGMKRAVGSSFDLDGDESVRIKEEWGIPAASPSPEAAAMEKEMWARFYETGFWRSPSQREDLLRRQNCE